MSDSTALSAQFAYSELQCDSRGAASAYTSSVNPTSWPRFYFAQHQIQPKGIKVVSAQIPFVFDTISSANNKFYFKSSVFPEKQLALAAGTYTGPELAAELESVLNTQYFVAGWTVSWNSTTFKFSITGGSPPEFRFVDPGPRLMLGFPLGTTVSGTTLVSPYAASPTGDLFLYVNSDTLGPGVSNVSPDNSGRINQICKIPIDVQKGGLISYKDPNPDQFFDFPSSKDTTTFDLYLTLGYEQAEIPVDMKGLGFSITLGVLSYRTGGMSLLSRPGQTNFYRG